MSEIIIKKKVELNQNWERLERNMFVIYILYPVENLSLLINNQCSSSDSINFCFSFDLSLSG